MNRLGRVDSGSSVCTSRTVTVGIRLGRTFGLRMEPEMELVVLLATDGTDSLDGVGDVPRLMT